MYCLHWIGRAVVDARRPYGLAITQLDLDSHFDGQRPAVVACHTVPNERGGAWSLATLNDVRDCFSPSTGLLRRPLACQSGIAHMGTSNWKDRPISGRSRISQLLSGARTATRAPVFRSNRSSNVSFWSVTRSMYNYRFPVAVASRKKRRHPSNPGQSETATATTP